MASFVIPEQAFDGFSDLIGMGPEKLERLSREASKRPLTLDLDGLISHLSSVIGFDEERLSRAIESVLIPVSSLRADFRVPAAEFVAMLTERLNAQDPKWFKKNRVGWDAITDAVASLLAPDGFFGQLSKAFRLLASRATQARGFSILTDLRPVYDEEVTRMTATLLTQTLVIDYSDGIRSSRLHLTLDQQDLRDLREQLDRAEKKAQLLEAASGVPLLIPGTDRK
ncbi:MAG: hypothetical protein ACRC33_24570 [Gemmataceae bacterium]